MPNINPNRRLDAVFFLVALVVLFADQFSKAWIRTHVHTGEVLFDIGFLRIIFIHNSGAAFGLFPQLSTVLTVIAFIGIPTVIICALFAHRFLPFINNWAGKSALGLVLGGTAGNLTDRLRIGYVTDFIDFKVWPTFNIADASITIGVIIIAYCILHSARHNE
ncbi:MAG: signal peptidase II [Dehalococcoidales bacterium]|nr:signal peptidase II [Dehalococcoidales bacterium]